MHFVVVEWFLPVKRAIFYAHFSFGAAIVVGRLLNFLLAEVIQGGNFKEVPLCALKSL